MNFKKIIDLSIPITNETPVYPGDPKPDIHPAAELDQDGYQVTQLNIGSHTGTHVDAPFHFQKEGERIDQSSLTKFMAPGLVIDVTGKAPAQQITMDDVADQIESVVPGTIVLFHTGWAKHIGTETYFEHPYLSVDIINSLLDKGVTTFFIDALNVDPPDGSDFPVHEAITSVNGIIGENFCNFDQIDFANPLIISLPLKLEGLDGSPVRAVAVEVE
ncbi:cyclase family protein [Guptibacillus hwajinpoensis]|uniref:Kynurenine formamidase n=1 Tax=Guptibacillus hwajinpoensis TaxID=208199 RepID=A0ABU0JZJ8_9BACL|nr:cyclase family protein [Alkalihalobacillus hemicentroti]MDQ0482538.1 kynurenine formamidase [Alkalihalobacillus hemicentroti]